MTFYNGLVLSGGSVKILNILGALQYASDKDMISGLKYYVGCSAGSIICYLLILGYSPSEMIVDMCINEKLSQFEMDVRSMVNLTGAMSYSKIHEYLESKTIDRFGFLPTLSELHEKTGKYLVAPTFNVTKGKLEYISHESHPTMPCLIALRMSSNLPFIFESFKYDYCEYVDGALGDYFPLSYTHNLIKEQEEKEGHIIGLCITLEDTTSDKLLDYIYKILSIPIKRSLERELEQTKDLDHDVIDVHSSSHTLAFNMPTHDKLELFSMGYQTAQKYLEFGEHVVQVGDEIDEIDE
jgi:predicted acylesterase/phospholipase RssA